MVIHCLHKLYFITLIIFLSFHTSAQTHRIDSLKNKIAITTNKAEKLETILNLCKERNSISSDTLYQYAVTAKELAGSLHDPLSASWADFYIAFRLLTKGMTDSCLKVAADPLKQTYHTSKDKNLYVRFFLLKVNALNRTNRTKEALNMLYTLLADAEKAGDIFTQIYVFNYIGTAYQIIGQSKEAQQWFYKATRLPGAAVTPLYSESYGSSLLNIGITYMSQYQEKPTKQAADSCEYFLEQAINSGKKNEYLSTVAYALTQKGLLLSYTARPQEAESLFKEGLKIRKQIGDPYYIISDIIGLGDFYVNTRQPEKGVPIIKEGIAIAQQFHVTADLAGLYGSLAENYKVAGNYLQYGGVLKQLIALKDSVYQKNSADQLAEMQTKYEVQKKENTIIRQNYDLSRKNYFIYGALGLLAATLLIGYGIFQNRKKNQSLKMQQLELEQKQKTTHAVMQAEEEERKRIAGDLHDSVAQKIVVAKLNLEAFGNHLAGLDAPQQKIYDNINNLLEESAREVRDLSHSMMPKAFSHSGLTDAVKDFLDTIALKNLQVHFNASGEFKNIPEITGLMIYRIIQECVQNALKHAKATRLDVAMIAENNELDVTIEDNGAGFDSSSVNDTNSSGMKNIKSRIEYLNGKVDINSQRGSGTVIAFFIPFTHS